MKIKHLYLSLATVSGLALVYQLALFTQAHGNDMALLFRQGFVNRGASFLSTDLLAIAVVALIFMLIEGKRIGMKKLWLPILFTFALGIGFSFPLFLYLREKTLGR